MNDADGNTTTVLPVLPEVIIFHVFTFWDVSTLVQKKQVSRTWREHCTNAINAKRTPATAKVFQTNKELRDTVETYTNVKENPDDAEELARTYGYPIGNWNVSNVEDFSYTFLRQYEFNDDINDWDVSNATNMDSMFYDAKEFNKPICIWNTSQVRDMESMFQNAKSFNQPLSNFDTSQVTEMAMMFAYASSFNQPLSNWNTSQVTSMSEMFTYAISFNQPLSHFDTSQVKEMYSMFHGASSFNHNISNWDTTQVEEDAKNMFYDAKSFHWDYAPVSLDPTTIIEVR